MKITEPRVMRLVLAFAAVYLVWGSTYLAIRVMVVQGLPPFLSAGARFVLAGLLMLAYGRLQGHRLPTRWSDWRDSALVGLALLLGGNGVVVWSSQWVNSNQVALLVSTSALWMAWAGTLGSKGERLHGLSIAGLLLGFGGVALLVGSGLLAGMAPWYAYAAIQVASFLWAMGSIYSKRHPVGVSSTIAVSLQMLSAGIALCLLGLGGGEAARWQWDPRAMAALAYLTVFGSCVAYGAYFWLVHEVSPARLGTYAYVNPAVAVILGWWLLDEHLLPMQIVGTLVILLAVVMVTIGSSRRSP